jgi:hypothetical protein
MKMDANLEQIKALADTVGGELAEYAAQVEALNGQVATLANDKDSLSSLIKTLRDSLHPLQLRAYSPLAVLPMVDDRLQARTDWLQPANAGDTGGVQRSQAARSW